MDADDREYTHPPKRLTRAVFGYSKSTGKDRCSGCFYFDSEDSECELYDMIESELPFFSLDGSVKPDGWCLAYTGKVKKQTNGLPLASMMR